MVIRVYESEDMFSDEDVSSPCSCSCSSCHNSPCNSTTNTSSNGHNVNSCPTSAYDTITSSHYMADSAYKDIVGNCKEVRIEENTCNLRIVGNSNRIRISINTGDLIIIGNNTRLKIQQNHGHIKYTGNDGRISLGHQSQQQLIDYIGCNGVLKICNSMKSFSTSKAKCTRNQMNVKSENINEHPVNGNSSCSKATDTKLYCHLPCVGDNAETTKPTAGVKTTTETCANRKVNKSKVKAHSYSGTTNFNPAKSSSSPWQTFNHVFQQANRKSMPNLSAHTFEPLGYCKREQPSSIVHNIGNIVIANASNICIAPFARSVTTKA